MHSPQFLQAGVSCMHTHALSHTLTDVYLMLQSPVLALCGQINLPEFTQLPSGRASTRGSQRTCGKRWAPEMGLSDTCSDSAPILLLWHCGG